MDYEDVADLIDRRGIFQIGINKQGSFVASLRIHHWDEEVIDEIKEKAGGGSKAKGLPKADREYPLYWLNLTSQKAIGLVRLCVRDMKMQKERALIMLEFDAQVQEWQKFCKGLALSPQEVKQRERLRLRMTKAPRPPREVRYYHPLKESEENEDEG